MQKYTLVVEFEDGNAPSIGRQSHILGGRICFLAFGDISKPTMKNNPVCRCPRCGYNNTEFLDVLPLENRHGKSSS